MLARPMFSDELTQARYFGSSGFGWWELRVSLHVYLRETVLVSVLWSLI